MHLYLPYIQNPKSYILFGTSWLISVDSMKMDYTEGSRKIKNKKAKIKIIMHYAFNF